MTMLDQMRQHRYWLKWSLFLVCVTFVFLYIPAFLTPQAPGAASDVIAQVEGRRITAGEFRRVYFQQIQSYQAAYGGNVNEQLLKQLGIDRQVLQQMIDEEAALVEARRLKLTVTDVEVRERILTLPGFQENGVFIGEARYRQLLRFQRPPLTPAEFEESVRRSLLQDKLRSALTDWIDVSDAELREVYRLRNEKVKLDIVTFAADSYKDRVTVSDAEIAEHLKANPAPYRIPEKRKIRFLPIETETLRAEIVVPPQDVERYYNDNLSQYATPEQVRASHILFKTEGKDEAEVRKQAEAVLAKIKAGGDFAALAKQYSEDTASASLGGDLDYFARGRMVPEFEQVAFSMEPGTVSDLVKTPYGFHIIKVVDKREASTRPFEDVREQIADQLQGEQARARVDALADQLSTEITTPDDLDRVAAEHGWTVQESNFFAHDGPIEGLGLAPGVAAAAFEFEPGQIAGPLRTATGQVFLTVTDTQESRAPKLEEVHDQVETDLIQVRAREAARRRAADLAPRLKRAADFTKAAKRAGLAVTTTDLIARGTPLPEIGQDRDIEATAFSLAAGETSDVLTTKDTAAIIHVAEREDATDKGFAESVGALRNEILLDRRNRFFSAYMGKAKERMQIDVNLQTLAQAVT